MNPNLQRILMGARKSVEIPPPLQISNLVNWQDSDDPSTFYTDSAGTVQGTGPLGFWRDKSGLNNSPNQTTNARRPTTGTRTINGRGAVDFDGTNGTLVYPSGMFNLPVGDNTQIIIFKNDTVGLPRLIEGVNTSSLSRYFQSPRAASHIGLHNNNGTSVASVSVADDLQPHIYIMRKTGSNVTCFVDGIPGSAVLASNITLISLAMGGVFGNPNKTDGAFGDIIHYDKSLSNAELNFVCGGYEAPKFGITWSTII